MSANAALPDITSTFRHFGVIPVIMIEDASASAGLARALTEGGLPCAEVTLRTSCALEAIERMRVAAPDLLLGAGTVLTEAQADDAVRAGARFVVAPGFNRKVVDWCRGRDVPVYPGVCTPTEIEAALDAGVRELKFFPAEAMGGVACLKAISAPYGAVNFIPTGGINLSNMASYLALPNVIACGGSWITSAADLSAGNFAAVRSHAADAAAEARRARPLA